MPARTALLPSVPAGPGIAAVVRRAVVAAPAPLREAGIGPETAAASRRRSPASFATP